MARDFHTLSAQANYAKGKTFTVTAEEMDVIEAAIIQNLERRGLPPVPYADAEGRLLFRGKGLEIEGTNGL